MLDKAIEFTKKADLLLIIGMSIQVYPKASLIDYVKFNTQICIINSKPFVLKSCYQNLTIIKEVASCESIQLIDLLKT